MLNNSFNEWGIDVGHLLGVRIRVHWMFVVYALISLATASDKQAMAIYMAVLFATVLIHEFGHIFAARHFHLDADRVVLWPLGGLAFVGRSRNAWEEFWISFYGPFTQLVLGGASAAWLYFNGAHFLFMPNLLMPLVSVGGPEGTLGLVVSIIFTVQVWLFALNVLLPAYPLDGGRMLVAMVINRVGALRASGMAMVLTLIVSGYLLVQANQLLGFCLMAEAAMLYQLRQTGEIYSHPSFSYGSSVYSSKSSKATKAKARAKVVSHLRLVESKLCPKCGRSLSPTAKMCGFCEISV
ncbi:hypothetical protein JST97_02160 [bacterium]|nr:hypothetical protein [bacterium]